MRKRCQERERILVVGAHPDDVDFAVAGTMAKWANQDKEIYYLICTGGDKGGTKNNYSADELVSVRQEEQKAAANLIGVKAVYFLNYKDGELVDDLNFRQELVRIIRHVCPQKIFSFDPANQKFDNFHLFHTDHRACALGVFDAIYPAAKNKMYFPNLLEEGLEPHKVDEAYFFGSYEPNIWLDITSTIDTKIQAISCHKSQFDEERLKMIEEMVKDRAAAAALGQDFKYAECFRKVSLLF